LLTDIVNRFLCAKESQLSPSTKQLYSYCLTHLASNHSLTPEGITQFLNQPQLGNGKFGLSRACTYLQLLVEGFSCKEISRRLGLSREHVSRVYRKKALLLLTEEFQSMVGNRG
jgi:hypothetical protein